MAVAWFTFFYFKPPFPYLMAVHVQVTLPLVHFFGLFHFSLLFTSVVSLCFSTGEQDYREKLRIQYTSLKKVVSIGNKIVPLVKDGSDVRIYLDNLVQG